MQYTQMQAGKGTKGRQSKTAEVLRKGKKTEKHEKQIRNTQEQMNRQRLMVQPRLKYELK